MTKSSDKEKSSVKELKPIWDTPEDYDKIEARILEIFRTEIYLPLLAELGTKKQALQNALDDLLTAITSGRISFNHGRFEGRFNSMITRELRKLGATWDRKTSTYRLPLSEMPYAVRGAISMSEAKFASVLRKIDDRFSKILPEEVAEKVKLEDLFERTLWKTEDQIQDSVKDITIAPKLTEEQAAKIAKDYTNNLKLYIKDFTAKETLELREKIKKSALKGHRYEEIIRDIQRSYGVSQNKAKFLARQETSLMMTSFKESRYLSAGVGEYKWQCVIGSPNHPVRPLHKKNNGKIFKWSDPPVVNEKGDRKNPGQDYNCRCAARPIVRF